MRKRLLYVFEFADKADSDSRSTADPLWIFPKQELKKLNKDVEFKVAKGIFKDRLENGLALRRLFNFLYMHISAPFHTMFADVLFVRTAPPLIQISYAFWAVLFRKKLIFWVMDYHPVFGVRTTKKNSLVNYIFRFFDKIDKFFLKKFDLAVCLDEAISQVVKKRAPNVKTLISPTYSIKEVEWLNLQKEDNPDAPLRLLYSGNLGRAHSIKRLEILLSNITKAKKVEFIYCGDSEYAKKTFQAMCNESGATFIQHGFIKNYENLGKFYQEKQIDYGIVLLNSELRGIVSPSKFSGYTTFGLPIIYLGPSDTNADLVCKKFKAGLSAESAEEIAEIAKKILLPKTRNECASATKDTLEYFSKKTAKFLAEGINEVLERI